MTLHISDFSGDNSDKIFEVLKKAKAGDVVSARLLYQLNMHQVERRASSAEILEKANLAAPLRDLLINKCQQILRFQAIQIDRFQTAYEDHLRLLDKDSDLKSHPFNLMIDKELLQSGEEIRKRHKHYLDSVKQAIAILKSLGEVDDNILELLNRQTDTTINPQPPEKNRPVQQQRDRQHQPDPSQPHPKPTGQHTTSTTGASPLCPTASNFQHSESTPPPLSKKSPTPQPKQQKAPSPQQTRKLDDSRSSEGAPSPHPTAGNSQRSNPTAQQSSGQQPPRRNNPNSASKKPRTRQEGQKAAPQQRPPAAPRPKNPNSTSAQPSKAPAQKPPAQRHTSTTTPTSRPPAQSPSYSGKKKPRLRGDNYSEKMAMEENLEELEEINFT